MSESIRAWRPDVPLVREVLHATFEHHAYPLHTHGEWTVLLIDDGAVTYELDRAEYRAEPTTLTILPPNVPHDGRSAVQGRPFRKRVLYVDAAWLPPRAADAAARRPTVRGASAVAAVRGVHEALQSADDAMVVEGRLHALGAVIDGQLGVAPSRACDLPLARRLRELLDDRITESLTIADAAILLDAHPSHLVRSFSRAYAVPPHRYVIGRRVDMARRLLLDGDSPAQAAVAAGFHDQAHLTRHFRRFLGTTPGAFAALA